MTMPKFELVDVGITDEQLHEATKPKFKFLSPGRYQLKIATAEWGKQNESDPTWYSLKLTLAHVDGREIKTVVMVPTKDAKFNKPGMKGNPYFLFDKFRQFVAGLGEKCSAKDIPSVRVKLFNNIKKLVGKAVDVTVGYQKDYVGKVGDVFKILDKSGREVKFEDMDTSPSFPDRASAIMEGLNYGLVLDKSFPEVIEYHQVSDKDDDIGF